MPSREIEPATPVLITAPDFYRLHTLLTRERARRAVIVRVQPRQIANGLWAAEVVQLRPFERRWVRPAAVAGGCMAVLAASAAAGWWLLGALVDAVTAAAAVSGATVLGVLAVLAIVTTALRRPSGCEITVTVRHRHR